MRDSYGAQEDALINNLISAMITDEMSVVEMERLLPEAVREAVYFHVSNGDVPPECADTFMRGALKAADRTLEAMRGREALQ